MSRVFFAGAVCVVSFCAVDHRDHAAHGAPAVPAMAQNQHTQDLIKGLAGGDEAARLQAIDILGEEGETTPEAVAALAAQLKDGSPLVRAHAAHALGHFGPAARPAVEALAPLVIDPDVKVQREAVRAWIQIRPGPAVSMPILGKVLQDADPSVRVGVLHLLADVGKPAVPALIQALKHEEAALGACLVLAEIGPDAAEAAPALIETLKTDTRPEVRREAVLALGAIGPAAAKAVPTLTELLGDSDTAIGAGAAYVLGRIGPEAKSAVPALSKCVDGDNPLLQTVGAWALAKIEPQNAARKQKAVALLVAALKSQQPRIRAAAARGLADLHPAPEMVLPALQEALEGGDGESRRNALEALASLGEAAVPALIEALKHEEIRPAVAMILGRIGPPAKQSVPVLANLVKGDKDVRVRCEALVALGAIGADAAAAVPTAIEALSDPQEKVCYGACYALGKIGSAAIAAKSELRKKLDDPDEFVAVAAAWALAKIDPRSPETAAKSVPLLIKGLANPEPKVRMEMALALRGLGPLAKEAVPALKQALADKDEPVRDTAAAALKAIGP